MVSKVSGNVLQDVKLRAAKMKNHIPDSELFGSENCRKYFRGLAQTLLGKRTKVNLFYDPESSVTGFTNGDTITVNAANTVISHYKTQLGRFQTALGVLFHEIAHCIYMDFNARNSVQQTVLKGRLWPSMPAAETEDQEDSLERIAEALSDERMANLLFSILMELDNVISDAHDENCMMRDHGEMVTTGILHAREAMKARCLPLEDLLEANAPPFQIMLSLILEYARFYDIVVLKPETLESEYALKLHEIENLIYNATEEDDVEEQFNNMNRILLFLWPYIEEELKSNNEDRDISDVIIDYYASYNAYTASLTAAAKVGKQTLLDYL